ncbi:MAG: sulfatase [Deltaproteobacteria bacterium]|nr:MAG: sulfatase [Deltaproteobacteria bacterium]
MRDLRTSGSVGAQGNPADNNFINSDTMPKNDKVQTNPDAITRRRFLQTTGSAAVALPLSVGLLSLLTGCGDSSGEEAPNQPNIILITADDLGWKDLGCFGDEQVKTPNLDGMCEDGVQFTNAFVTAPSCSPSRACLATGQYPHTNGVDGLVHRYPEKSLPPGTPTLASLLAEAGYRTALQGKWHIAVEADPTEFGYDENLSDVIEQFITNDLDIEISLDFIERNRANPFYLEINSKHNHRQADGSFLMDPDFPVDPDSIHVPEYWHLPDWPEIREETAMYYSQTRRLDWIVGRVLGKLEELDLVGSTLIVFLGDNGAPFPGMKMTQYDRGIGTPLIAWGPSRFRSGKQVKGLVSTIDLMPTLLDAAGVAIPDWVEGESILPLLAGEETESTREAIFSEMTYHVEYLPSRAVRTAGWKYIKNYSDNPVGLDQNADMEWAQQLAELPDQPWLAPRVEEELYNLAEDPDEQNNLAGDPGSAEMLDHLRGLLRDHMIATNDPFLDAPFTHDYTPPEEP